MTKSVEIISVYRTTILQKGRGTVEDPHRYITQYWDLDGVTLLAEDDPFTSDRVTTLRTEIFELTMENNRLCARLNEH